MPAKENPYKTRKTRREFLRILGTAAAGIVTECAFLPDVEKEVIPKLPGIETDEIEISSIPYGADIFTEGYVNGEKVSVEYFGKTLEEPEVKKIKLKFLYYFQETPGSEKNTSVRSFPDFYLIHLKHKYRERKEFPHYPNKRSENDWKALVPLDRL